MSEINVISELPELANPVEIKSFDASELISNEDITKYITENIPLAHLKGCESISYNPDYSHFSEKPGILGCWNTKTNEININEHRALYGRNGLLETVTHEIGHNAQQVAISSNEMLDSAWKSLHEASFKTYEESGRGFVSSYAMTNHEEDFAECYANYVLDPESLAFFCPEKFAFMKEIVFGDHATTELANNVKNLELSDGQCFVCTIDELTTSEPPVAEVESGLTEESQNTLEKAVQEAKVDSSEVKESSEYRDYCVCGTNCSGSCRGSCSGGCSGRCSGSCSGTCSGGCSGSCFRGSK